MAGYAIVLTVGAREAIREMGEAEKQLLAIVLRAELLDGRGSVIRPYMSVPTGSPVDYIARLLSSGHVAVFRTMVEDELKALARQRHESVARSGVVVHDILARSTRPRYGSGAYGLDDAVGVVTN
jgi:hypothetical protein